MFLHIPQDAGHRTMGFTVEYTAVYLASDLVAWERNVDLELALYVKPIVLYEVGQTIRLALIRENLLDGVADYASVRFHGFTHIGLGRGARDWRI